MASMRKQILIETHSEHIVNAIRAESVEAYLRDAFEVDLSEGVPRSQYTILFLENEGKGPQLHRLNILRDGTVPEWPASFFGESSQLLGRILRAQRKAKGKA
jgi:predicted ATPase